MENFGVKCPYCPAMPEKWILNTDDAIKSHMQDEHGITPSPAKVTPTRPTKSQPSTPDSNNNQATIGT